MLFFMEEKMKRGTTVLLAVFIFALLISCGGKKSETGSTSSSGGASGPLVEAPFSGWVEGLPKIEAPSSFDWKQFSGTTLNFISENTTPSTALAAAISTFENVTGITVNIEQADLAVVAEKVALDINARSAKYQLIYADPHQILAKNYRNLVDLNKFINDPSLPRVPGGLEDFFVSQLEVDGYFGSKNALYALPYDCPTVILAYRTDIFENETYKKAFQDAKGYDWTPGPNLTWEQFYEVADWINQQVKAGKIQGVQYGSGHMAKQHDSLQCDFSNVLASYGGDYFVNRDLGILGSAAPGQGDLDSPEAIAAATMYQKLLSIAHPGSTSWDWAGVSEAFAAGQIAMIPEFSEFSATFESPTSSKVVGKVKWAPLPKGPKGTGNIYGGTGIAISSFATEQEQKAAWLFLVWATSPQAQYECLTSPVGGSTPTRHSVYALPDVIAGMTPGTPESQKMPNLISAGPVQLAWAPGSIYNRPKIPQWPEIDTVIYTELSRMILNQSTPERAMRAINNQIKDIVE
jgi:multiple sugar transport system substrate-binding protein